MEHFLLQEQDHYYYYYYYYYYDDDDDYFIIVHLEHKILSMTSKKFNEIWRSLKGFLVYKKRPLPCARPTNAGV